MSGPSCEVHSRYHDGFSADAREPRGGSQRFGEARADLEKRGTRIDDFDVAIAAHALAYEATVITDNVRHFKRIRNLLVERWTEE